MPIGYWESEHLLAPADLTIIGSGIVGMSAALHYKSMRPDHRVRIIERDVLGEGGTTRNAGFACFGGPGEWLDDVDSLGTEGWIALMERRAAGLAALVDLLGTAAIGLQWSGGWELFDDTPNGRSRAGLVLERLEGLSAVALPILKGALGGIHPTPDQPALVLDAPRGRRFGAHLAVRLPWEGMLHTGRMVAAFHHALNQADIQRVHGCAVQAVHGGGPPHEAWALETGRGTLASRRLALCSNGFAADLLPGIDVAPAPNRVLVVHPEKMPPEGAYHLDDGYLYFRTLSPDRVLFGGGRHFGISLPAHPERSEGAERDWDERLQAEAERWLGPIKQTTHRWTGWLGVGRDRQPLVGTTSDGMHHAVRMGGMGIAMGCGIGKELAQRVARED